MPPRVRFRSFEIRTVAARTENRENRISSVVFGREKSICCSIGKRDKRFKKYRARSSNRPRDARALYTRFARARARARADDERSVCLFFRRFSRTRAPAFKTVIARKQQNRRV